jgi:hypothetical protein
MTKAVKFSDFGGGINNYTRPTMIQDKETPLSENVWATGKNSLEKRPGFSLIGQIPTVNKVSGIGTFYGSSRKLLAMAGGKLWDVKASPEQIGATTWTADLKTDFCQAAGRVFISNGSNVLREYNGTAISDTTNGVVGMWSIFYKGCLWVAGNATYPTRLYRSGTDTKIGDFTYNETGNPLATSVYIGKDDGQNITGMFKHQDYLYILKENSIWSVSQSTDEFGTVMIELIDPSRGCTNHRTIDSVDNDTFFFNDKGVFAFGYEPNIQTQIRTNVISLRVDVDVKTIQKSRLDDTAGIYFDNKYYLAYTVGGGSNNDAVLVYDRQRMGWWKLPNLSFNCFTEYKDSDGYSKLYAGSDVDGKVFYLDDNAKTDNGTAIKTKYKTAKWSFKDEFQTKFFLFALLYFGGRPADVIIEIYIDDVLVNSLSKTIGISGGGGMGTGAIGTFPIGVEDGEVATDTGGGDFAKVPINKIGRNIQIVITDLSTSKGWEINGIEINLKPLDPIYQPNT